MLAGLSGRHRQLRPGDLWRHLPANGSGMLSVVTNGGGDAETNQMSR